MIDIEDIKLYTLEEVAPVLGVTKQTLFNYIRAGKLPAKKIGRVWKVTGEMLKQFIEEADSTPRKYNRKNATQKTEYVVMDGDLSPEEREAVIESFKDFQSWDKSLMPAQRDYLCNAGYYNNAIKGYMIAAAKFAKRLDPDNEADRVELTDGQIRTLLQAMRWTLDEKTKEEAEKIYNDF